MTTHQCVVSVSPEMITDFRRVEETSVHIQHISLMWLDQEQIKTASKMDTLPSSFSSVCKDQLYSKSLNIQFF